MEEVEVEESKLLNKDASFVTTGEIAGIQTREIEHIVALFIVFVQSSLTNYRAPPSTGAHSFPGFMMESLLIM